MLTLSSFPNTNWPSIHSSKETKNSIFSHVTITSIIQNHKSLTSPSTWLQDRKTLTTNYHLYYISFRCFDHYHISWNTSGSPYVVFLKSNIILLISIIWALGFFNDYRVSGNNGSLYDFLTQIVYRELPLSMTPRNVVTPILKWSRTHLAIWWILLRRCKEIKKKIRRRKRIRKLGRVLEQKRDCPWSWKWNSS